MLAPFVDGRRVRVERATESSLRPSSTSDLPTAYVADSGLADGKDESISVEAVRVHHEPVREAVAFRITTTAGVVVISVTVCDEVLDLALGADVLVHEACRVWRWRR